MDRLPSPLEESIRSRSPNGGSPQEEDIQEQDAFAPSRGMAPGRGATELVPALWRGKTAPPGLRAVRLVRRSPSPRHRLSRKRERPCPMAITGPG